MILSGGSKAFKSAVLTYRMMLVTSAFERHMVKLHENTSETFLWCSIVAVSDLKMYFSVMPDVVAF